MKTIFISYHFKDRTYKGEIQRWLEERGASVISVDESDLRPEGSEAVKARIRADLSRASHVLVLVGDDTHNRPWVDYEVAVVNWVRRSNSTVRLQRSCGGFRQ
jgi:MTH538 TIR-like domain (DUF1863)